jgi:hypothetical protein
MNMEKFILPAVNFYLFPGGFQKWIKNSYEKVKIFITSLEKFPQNKLTLCRIGNNGETIFLEEL